MVEPTVPTNPQIETQATPETREEDRFLRPPVDIYETAEGLTVLADMPGVDRDSVDIRVEDNILTIKGRTTYRPEHEMQYTEFTLLDYFRQFQLNEQVDQEKITAELKHGVLKVRLPKVARAKPRQIQVQVG